MELDFAGAPDGTETPAEIAARCKQVRHQVARSRRNMWRLWRGRGAADPELVNTFERISHAMTHVGRPQDEWVWDRQNYHWFHAGGNAPGEWWVIDLHPQDMA